MKKIINIYKKDQIQIKNYILSIIKSMPSDYLHSAKSILKKYKYIELIYSVGSDYKQNSPAIYKNKILSENIDSDKSHYFLNIKMDPDGLYISNPYIHHSTGKPSISVVCKKDDNYFVFDVNLIQILEELRLIDYNSVHEKFMKIVYLSGASILSMVSLSLIGYGAYVLISLMLSLQSSDFLHDIFKSIIAVTIGLAMFDLAKQIIEHEVLFRSFQREEKHQLKVLGNFLIAIIIALSIETLMVVFKIVLDDYSNMLSAFYLLLGTTIMFVGLAYFHKSLDLNKKIDDYSEIK